jgi:hypothetical protein
MSDDLRTVATFATPADAAIARNALEAAGVSAAIADELTLTADPFLSGALNFIKVQVRESDLERAAEVLGDRGLPIPVDMIGDAGHDDDDGPDEFPPEPPGERQIEFGYRAAIFGLVSCPVVLHLYSLVQILWAAARYPDLSPTASRRFWIALAIDLAMLTLAGLAVAGLLQL